MGEAAGIASVAQLIGGTASAANGYAQRGAYLQQGSFQRQIANQNSQLANLQAADAIQRGNIMAVRENQKAAALVGAQRASMGSQGVDVNTGSTAQIQADTAGLSAIDQLTIKNNAAREAWGYNVQALQSSAQGKMDYLAARGNANSTMLTGGLGFLKGGMMGAYYAAKEGTPDYSTPGIS